MWGKYGIEIIIIQYGGYGNTGYGVSSLGIPWMFGSRQTLIAKNMTNDMFFSILYYPDHWVDNRSKNSMKTCFYFSWKILWK